MTSLLISFPPASKSLSCDRLQIGDRRQREGSHRVRPMRPSSGNGWGIGRENRGAESRLGLPPTAAADQDEIINTPRNSWIRSAMRSSNRQSLPTTRAGGGEDCRFYPEHPFAPAAAGRRVRGPGRRRCRARGGAALAGRNDAPDVNSAPLLSHLPQGRRGGERRGSELEKLLFCRAKVHLCEHESTGLLEYPFGFFARSRMR